MKKFFAIIAMVTIVTGVYAFSVDTDKPKTAESKSACATVENVVKTSAVECGGAEVVKTANAEKAGCGDANVVKTANIVEKAADCSEAGGAEAVATKAEGACCSEKAENDTKVAENK